MFVQACHRQRMQGPQSSEQECQQPTVFSHSAMSQTLPLACVLLHQSSVFENQPRAEAIEKPKCIGVLLHLKVTVEQNLGRLGHLVEEPRILVRQSTTKFFLSLVIPWLCLAAMCASS